MDCSLLHSDLAAKLVTTLMAMYYDLAAFVAEALGQAGKKWDWGEVLPSGMGEEEFASALSIKLQVVAKIMVVVVVVGAGGGEERDREGGPKCK
uniref:Uncharacterized protein n=1 Tax=Oryza nivara TaxID=4536 RepID=A0A0E0HP32_ORYNI